MSCPILTVPCTRCQQPIQRRNTRPPKEAYCMPCRIIRREERRVKMVLPCRICGVPVTFSGNQGLEKARNGRSYCSPEHKRQWEYARNAARGAELGKRLAAQSSARMKARNPMSNPATLQKVRETLRAIKHRPKVQGGNGRALPVPHQMLWDALGPAWHVEYITKTNKVNGLPSAIKSDLALPEIKLAVEVDGGSHCSLKVQEKDARKTAFLNSLGWTVLRFTNKAVMADLAICVREIESTISKLRTPTPTSLTE